MGGPVTGPPDPSRWRDPHPALADTPLPMIEFAPGAVEFFQCYRHVPNPPPNMQNRGPLSFNPFASGRFNAPAKQFGTTYLSMSIRGAFVETVVQNAALLPPGTGSLLGSAITQQEIDYRQIVRIELVSGRLCLVDFTAEGLVQAGTDNQLCSCHVENRGRTQRWALALHDHPDKPDGIIYRARHDPACISLAVFDRAENRLRAVRSINYLGRPEVLAELVTLYNVALM